MAKKSFFQLVTGRDADDASDENLETSATGAPDSETESDETLNDEGQLTIDVYQTPDEMIIKSTIAGVKSEDLDITIANDMVTIQGTRKKDENVSPEDYYYQELYWGPFSRSVILPQEVDPDSAKASLKEGILTIKLPKFERGRTKKLRINSA